MSGSFLVALIPVSKSITEIGIKRFHIIWVAKKPLMYAGEAQVTGEVALLQIVKFNMINLA